MMWIKFISKQDKPIYINGFAITAIEETHAEKTLWVHINGQESPLVVYLPDRVTFGDILHQLENL